jgi:mRNA-degrading endonuclease RelE of RelBE toxin-antitoxin system
MNPPMAYTIEMVFIETSVFTKAVDALLSQEEFCALQNELLVDPESGALIRASGGIRKLRFGLSGRGKRGGVRVIYYLRSNAGEIYLILIYPKNEKDDLSANELKVLRAYVEELK